MKNFVQEGKSLEFVAVAAETSGDFVDANGIIGVAAVDMAIGETGVLSIVGVYKVPNPDSVVFAQGATVGYVKASNKAIAGGAGDYDIGKAFKASSGAEDVEVLLPLGPR